MPDREFDIVLFGATGFVGRLTAQHLAEQVKGAADGVRIALAGRSLERLEEVRGELTGPASSWPLLVVDASDESAVRELAARTQVVVTTVGPYLKYGKALVAACADAGTHYCDLTGEVVFVQHSVAAHHVAAQRSGARIVHGCGFDSIPSDLGVYLTWRAAQDDGAGDLTRTNLAVTRLKGGFSGGTIDSARGQLSAAVADPAARRALGDPWSLAEGPRPSRPAVAAGGSVAGGVGALVKRATRALPVRRDAEGHFTAPFVMASYNVKIVNRSASLLNYGPAFRYSEYTDCGPGVRGAAMAGGMAAALGIGGVALAFGPTRRIVDPLLPKPGEGPSEKAMARGRFAMEITGTTSTGASYRTTVAAPYDPGYSGTAIMLGQSALALVSDSASLPDRSGVLTPATAIGMPLVERLRRHQFTFATKRTT